MEPVVIIYQVATMPHLYGVSLCEEMPLGSFESSEEHFLANQQSNIEYLINGVAGELAVLLQRPLLIRFLDPCFNKRIEYAELVEPGFPVDVAVGPENGHYIKLQIMSAPLE